MINIVKTLDNKGQRHGGLCAQLSWQKLGQLVLTPAERADGKKVVQISASPDGVTFTSYLNTRW